jgi:PhnB protein
MAADVKPVPDNSSVLIPRLFCRDLRAEIEFLKAAFGAEDPNRRPGPDGRIIHALLTIRGQMLMLEAEYPTLPSRVPALDGTSPVVIFVYVEEVDRVVEKATSLGARLLIPVKDQFWGDRTGWIMDPEGHVWTVATRIEETTALERSERWEKIRTS